mmetsp:Transcript_101294/g.180005  ORF Transcript_101294/g.180005 Transcript_101294/m.180005 type:complete len:380 (-) Transcript_101294:76-1215(-)
MAASIGNLMTMPVLIVNMGGEMVYILAQRLQAQKIADAKGQKVLCDVVRTMYYPRFIEELFKTQEIYSLQSTRQIFDRLAHSSIMRLNESSMDKLFDLMIMGFKLQLMSSTTPREVIDVTNNHLDELRRLAGDGDGVRALVDECVKQVQQAYGGMSLSGLCAMRQSLAVFVQDRKVKVSLFLHENAQKADGSFVVPSTGTLAPGALPPGTVRYFSGGVEANREQVPTVSSSAWEHNTGMRTQLGCNIYEKDRQPPPASNEAAAAAAPGAPAPPPPPPPAPSVSDEAKKAAAVGELNMLASLIGAGSAPSSDTFKLESLFGSDIFGKDSSGKSVEVIQIDGTASTEHRTELDSIRDSMEVEAPPPPPPGEDDLLDLMDNA